MLTSKVGKMLEIVLKTSKVLKNPFWDVEIKAEFILDEMEQSHLVHGFYDGVDSNGNHVWKLRWNPIMEGTWQCNVISNTTLTESEYQYTIDIGPNTDNKGFLRTNTSTKWGLEFDNKEPYFLFGDTMYNLFGAHYCDVDTKEILKHRSEQGINYIRARLQVSPYHPETRNQWQTKDCWPWGGSSQIPDFTQFNLEYFHAVDEVVKIMEDLNMGIEMILEGWLWEFPFNDRSQFIQEYEEHWVKYIVSRYAAYSSVYVWCPANEYEFYPKGEVKYNQVADRWIKRLSTIIRSYDPANHLIGIHNWEKNVPLYERVGDHDDIDLYLVQTEWGQESSKYKRDASLCMWLEKDLRVHAQANDKVVICSEFGYERTEGLYTVSIHQKMDHHHTRRGQWRAGFSGYTVVHGFDNTWGAHMDIDKDPKGTSYLLPYIKFMTEEINFFDFSTTQQLFNEVSGNLDEGTLPLCLANDDLSTIAVYFPTRGSCTLNIDKIEHYKSTWYDPRTGEKINSQDFSSKHFSTPDPCIDSEEWGDDWILLLSHKTSQKK